MSDSGSDTDEQALTAGSASLGLHNVLTQAGIDPSQFSSFFGKEAGGGGGGGGEAAASSSAKFAELEAEDDPDKYEDDVDLGDGEGNVAESSADALARERERREEERWARRGEEMQRQARERVEKKRAAAEREKGGRSKLDKVREVWPEFESGKGKRVKMSEVFYETPREREKWEKGVVSAAKRRRTDRKEYMLQLAPHGDPAPQSTFLLPALPPLGFTDPHTTPLYDRPIGELFAREWVRGAKEKRRREMTRPPPGVNLEWASAGQMDGVNGAGLQLGDWEKDIIMCSLFLKTKSTDPLQARNDMLDSGNWLRDIIWDARRVSPGLLESDAEDEDPLLPPANAAQPAAVDAEKQQQQQQQPASKQLDLFNLSNDHIYEHTKEGRFRIRQTFGAIEVFHSGPAKALQMPFYKTTLSKTDARAWHRPALQFPVGLPITFSKLKSNPSASVSSKKKAVMADPSERFKSTKDLTMTEKGPYVLMEFSEEYPPIMSNYGMGTTIVNYYRKKDDKDEHVPKLDFGQPSILNPGDAEPFLLGYVDRGAVTQVIHNNLIRAPIFRHTPATTDFLVIRQTINGNSSYHIRPISNVFTVGQTVPNESEVPGPHARKNTNTAKTRLMIVAWLLIQKSKSKSIKIGELEKYFPGQTELQMRQRLKIKGHEFLIYARAPSPTQGYWTLNPEYGDFPNDRASVLQQCTPEQAVLYEAMQVGARHLHDAGYSKTAEGSTEDDLGDEAGGGGLDIEQRLAVWSTTLNYKKAEAQKAWLVVHGEGDPTGRGEGWSFLRGNMKDWFLREGETAEGRRLEAEAKASGGPVKISNAEQNRIYDEEKRRVWDKQWKALSSSAPPELSAQDEERDQLASTPAGIGPRFGTVAAAAGGGRDSRRGWSRQGSMVDGGIGSPGAWSADGGESMMTGGGGQKVMRIKRVVKGKTQVEIVRDPQVIATYLRRVEEKKLELYMQQADELRPTGNLEEDELKKAALRQEIERYKKNQQRRLARKKYAKGTLEDFSEGAEEAGKRKCGACGQIGHTKANRNCPMFNAAPAHGRSPSALTPGGAAQTPGSYGGYGFGFPPPESPAAESPGGAGTSFKIRLGLGGGGQR